MTATIPPAVIALFLARIVIFLSAGPPAPRLARFAAWGPFAHSAPLAQELFLVQSSSFSVQRFRLSHQDSREVHDREAAKQREHDRSVHEPLRERPLTRHLSQDQNDYLGNRANAQAEKEHGEGT